MLVPKRDWETVFTSWAAGPSATEQQKCENAARAVTTAIKSSNRLSQRNIQVFIQGSYRNRTNVRQDSDVDICVLCEDSYFWDTDGKVRPEEWGWALATYEYSVFKDEVEIALIAHFGPAAVTRGNKAFDVNENTYRIDADVVPCFTYSYFCRTSSGGFTQRVGAALLSDDGKKHFSYPDQHYENGVEKNEATGRRFKKLVRIVKRLRNEMLDAGINEADFAPSFLIECLVWNVPNEGFRNGSFKGDLRFVLAHLWNNTRTDAQCINWTEVNGLKFLFHPAQPWTRERVHAFLGVAWDYVGFE